MHRQQICHHPATRTQIVRTVYTEHIKTHVNMKNKICYHFYGNRSIFSVSRFIEEKHTRKRNFSRISEVKWLNEQSQCTLRLELSFQQLILLELVLYFSSDSDRCAMLRHVSHVHLYVNLLTSNILYICTGRTVCVVCVCALSKRVLCTTIAFLFQLGMRRLFTLFGETLLQFSKH